LTVMLISTDPPLGNDLVVDWRRSVSLHHALLGSLVSI